ncbi:RNase P subunit p30-domain-containing protein [Aspergillus minisclerotigenes]|uniref:RNase P subunit p30-domain-containing protein n=1 Tax=Aspergillus minisclerotigenes TaxID=656917 RepID=A0A5N6J5U3_9EURO|nr:RNase P subunit p30-domain-containing protein [Aspergillus minisclerotigenes]
MFYDLNVSCGPDDPELSPTLSFLAELGYTTIALSQTLNGKLPPNPTPPPVPTNVPKGLTILTRVNLPLSDPTQNQRLTTLTQAYDLVAIRPANEKALLNACTNLECDVISLDLSVRQPYHFKFKMLSAAIARGIRFEICYGPGVTGSGADARRNLIGNAMSLIRATRGRGIIISSEARKALAVRAPWDVINLACVWGLSQERGKEAICEEARKTVALAKLKRTSWRGIIDVIDGGEKPKPKTDKPASKQKGAASKQKDTPQSESNSDTLKRKASVEETEKPLSKREMKRRAKKARLGVIDGEDSATTPANS